jgi:tetratricopeptide (TPR) repeat protein
MSAADYYDRGVAGAQGEGGCQAAIADLTEAIRLDPRHAAAYKARAQLRLVTGRHAEAIADFTEAIRLDPQDAATRVLRGVACYHIGEPGQAVIDFAEGIRHNPVLPLAYYERSFACLDALATRRLDECPASLP